MTAVLSKPVDTSKLASATPGIYPYELTSGNYAGRMAVYVPPTYMPRVQQIPGARYSKGDQVWTLPKAYPAVLSLSAMAKETGLRILPHPELNAWVIEQSKHWKALRALSAAYTPGATKGPDDLFYPHQEDDGEWFAYGDGVEPMRARLLLSETGIGKTAGTINGMRKLGLPAEGRPVLIAAPKKTLKTAWVDDLEQFLPGAVVSLARGTVTQRRKAIQKVADGEANVLVIGWDSLKTHTRFAAFPGQALKKCEACGGPKQSEENAVSETRCQKHEKELNAIDWALVVGDELHRVMNATSQTTMALWGLVRSAPEALRWGLTGTPVSTEVEQAWTLLHYADAEAWPVKSAWVDYYAESGYNYSGYYETSGFKPARHQEFQDVFSGITRRRLKAEVLDLPPLLMGGGLIREVDMAKEQAAAYKQMREEMLLKVSEGVIVAANQMVAAGRLTMLASATGYPEDPEATGASTEDDVPVKMLLRMPSGKIDAVIEDLKSGEFGTDSVAMSLESRRLLRLLEGQMIEAGIGPDQIAVIAGDMSQAACDQAIYDFQDGKKRYMLYTYAAGGTGVTLTAARWLLRVQRSWSPILWKQGLDRVHRIGSERHDSINVVDYITSGTIEEKQIDRHGENTHLLEQVVQDKPKLSALFE